MSVSLQWCLGGSHEKGKQCKEASVQLPHLLCRRKTKSLRTQRTSDGMLSNPLILFKDYEAPVQKDQDF